MCCSVLQCEEASKAGGEHEKVSVLPCVAVCCSVLQCVAVCCSVLQCVAVCCSLRRPSKQVESVRRLVSCNVLQRVAVCCSVLE